MIAATNAVRSDTAELSGPLKPIGPPIMLTGAHGMIIKKTVNDPYWQYRITGGQVRIKLMSADFGHLHDAPAICADHARVQETELQELMRDYDILRGLGHEDPATALSACVNADHVLDYLKRAKQECTYGFYVADAEKSIWGVCVYWVPFDGWSIRAAPITHAVPWRDGTIIVTR